ncbi:two-component system chemotaxis response regulator CheY [Caldicellulosiruptor bescii]|jgi:two-component system chemotaxis response regulator CheY|uniref:Response regulator receiver protein n=2 Tax=Caldicellulosiruptor bescii TaxID=31899 RepID=B9MPE5_CALBD|nr:response regulator [Caldicellulosiruptor bescii]ACM59706.1 response regulator receiver protein [Caldicellulosiruptor bescii DSM 6725]PBC89731.1 two-component system chemotaxis response regulator CheY [Caldicellulosiruptor bescii]PBC90054.1 two-component system chemotaxis response regulator CheY [Caldicellulosiruptor bescii]PBD04515.1 two-component system chemotaxis response regulator CheY [Caldicellulosiruptor bescii]PBD05851.1 two-component system chemotaxis response regulator CheY [Caldic
MPKILVVDDSPVVKKIVTTTLVKKGFDVKEAIDGVAALEILLSEKIDLVITDLNMPKMDGLQLTREIRKNPMYKRIPVIMLTTNPSEEQKALEAGANLYLKKPVTSEELISHVQKFLGIEMRS